jgi:hypothetical protein
VLDAATLSLAGIGPYDGQAGDLACSDIPVDVFVLQERGVTEALGADRGACLTPSGEVIRGITSP